jgi:hypothetical protein
VWGGVVFALLAALCNAVSVIARHIASTADPNRPSGRRLIGYLLRSPQWLAGWAAQGGLVGLFTHWPVYAVAVGGAAGVVLEQAALQAGPLRVSQPLLTIIDPVVSIALSVWLFGEYFVMNAAVLAAASAGFCVMCVGVVVMSLTAPATLQADIDRAEAPRTRSA